MELTIPPLSRSLLFLNSHITAPHAIAAYTLKTALSGGLDLGQGYPGGVSAFEDGGDGIEEVDDDEVIDGGAAALGRSEEITLDTTQSTICATHR